MAIKQHHLTMNVLRIPDHQSHRNHNICAKVPVQCSDVHDTNASTSEYAQNIKHPDVPNNNASTSGCLM